jgi:hypothetical protein
MKLLRSTCDPETCRGVLPHGRIYQYTDNCCDLRRLAEDGLVRLTKASRRGAAASTLASCYVLTAKGWKAKASGRFEP